MHYFSLMCFVYYFTLEERFHPQAYVLPIYQTVREGNSATFRCISLSDEIYWLVNDNSLIPSYNNHLQGNLLHLANVTKSDQAVVRCMVVLDGEIFEASARLYVKGGLPHIPHYLYFFEGTLHLICLPQLDIKSIILFHY